MRHILIVFFQWIVFLGLTQGNWSWVRLANLPIPTANNALTEVVLGTEKFVYSFGGIGENLDIASIHQRTFKYRVSSDVWTEVQSIPDTLGKIGAVASFVRNRIYLIGGYHVDGNGNEYTSNKVHIFNPFIDTFELDGASLPVPVDDHVQAVWRDSLIFVITGWSNNQNVSAVQIYNPYFDSWEMGESVPNNSDFRAFGASGYILGDTIYYFGGVAGSISFLARNYLRKGVINPDNPTEIEWLVDVDLPFTPRYRSACSGHDKTVFWLGGAELAYNFDALAYDGSGLVEPAAKILHHNTRTNNETEVSPTDFGTMDHRGIAKLNGGNWIIAGGIDSLGQVSNRTFLLNNPTLSFIDQMLTPPFFAVSMESGFFRIQTENVGDILVFDTAGKLLMQRRKQLADLLIPAYLLNEHFLIFVYNDGSNVPVSRKIVNMR
jgi:hypothetical protein